MDSSEYSTDNKMACIVHITAQITQIMMMATVVVSISLCTVRVKPGSKATPHDQLSPVGPLGNGGSAATPPESSPGESSPALADDVELNEDGEPAVIYLEDPLKPMTIKRNAKESKIVKGLIFRSKSDYPTMADIVSDWDTTTKTSNTSALVFTDSSSIRTKRKKGEEPTAVTDLAPEDRTTFHSEADTTLLTTVSETGTPVAKTKPAPKVALPPKRSLPDKMLPSSTVRHENKVPIPESQYIVKR